MAIENVELKRKCVRNTCLSMGTANVELIRKCVAAQVVRLPGIPMDACSSPGCRSKSCDLLPAFTACNTRSSGGTAHEGGGATSKLDLPSLTPLSVACRGRLQLKAPHWATSVDYCKKLIIDPIFCSSIFSTGRLLAIDDFTFLTLKYRNSKCVTHAQMCPQHLSIGTANVELMRKCVPNT